MKRNHILIITILAIYLFGQTSCQKNSSQNMRITQEISLSQGGKINFPNHVSVYFPPGAVLTEQAASIIHLIEKPIGDEQNISILGEYFEIKADQEIFFSPITITLSYNEELLPEGRSEGEIYAVFLDDGIWYRMYGEVNKEKNTISIDSFHASIWSWGIDLIEEQFLGYHASMYNCIFNRQNPDEIPSTLSDAYELRDERLQEWKDTIRDADISLHRLDSNLQKRLDELGVDWTNDLYGELALESEMALVEIIGVNNIDKVLVIEAGKNFLGIYSLIKSSIQAFQTDLLSGDVLAITLKVKAAQQRYMASKAYVYAFENPDAKTIPEEYLKALQTVCYPEIQIGEGLDSAGSCIWEETIVGDWNGVSGDQVIAQLSFLNDGTLAGAIIIPYDNDNLPVQGNWKCDEGLFFMKRSDEADFQKNSGNVIIIDSNHIQIHYADGSIQDLVRR